jgi:Fringe-like
MTPRNCDQVYSVFVALLAVTRGRDRSNNQPCKDAAPNCREDLKDLSPKHLRKNQTLQHQQNCYQALGCPFTNASFSSTAGAQYSFTHLSPELIGGLIIANTINCEASRKFLELRFYFFSFIMPWSPGGRSKRFRFPAFTPLFLFPAILVTLIFWWNTDAFFGSQHKQPIYGYAPGISNRGACTKWQGASDVVIVMKTGASEIEAKLPIHLSTTFKCAPNVMVFSDMAQQFEGLRIHDPLRHLATELDKTDPDLMYYMSLMERQRKGNDIVKGNNTQAWALDRYKNIPMLRRAYETYPDAKWFVFMDADTALIWSNLLTWLSQMDSSEPRYIGSSVVGGKWQGRDNIRFAHGGTGYIISHAAAKIIAEETDEEQKKSFEITREDCCGDSALAKVLRTHGIVITPAFPNVNGQTLYHVDYGRDSLCFAPVTMHHMNAEEIKELVKYQEILTNGRVSPTPIIP